MMTSKAARQIADKIDSLEEQVTQGEFVPQGRQDILNTTVGRPDHGGRVRAAGSGSQLVNTMGGHHVPQLPHPYHSPKNS